MSKWLIQASDEGLIEYQFVKAGDKPIIGKPISIKNPKTSEIMTITPVKIEMGAEGSDIIYDANNRMYVVNIHYDTKPIVKPDLEEDRMYMIDQLVNKFGYETTDLALLPDADIKALYVDETK